MRISFSFSKVVIKKLILSVIIFVEIVLVMRESKTVGPLYSVLFDKSES